ncbi:MAG: zinc-ribbon domain-containing protein [Pyrinomonadaceae bacterium]
MFCPKCGNQNGEDERFCRKCGTDLQNLSLTSVERNLLPKKTVRESLSRVKSKDPDELTGNGIGSVIIGDGFFMVAVILSATHSSVSSLLWLFLLIPAFFFFGKGFADVLHARQIRRRLKQNELSEAPKIAELPRPRASVVDVFKKSISGELAAVPSVTERTTRDLK